MTRDELLDLFRRSGALLEGHFRLTSGLHSGSYLQCALVLQHPARAESLGRSVATPSSSTHTAAPSSVVSTPRSVGTLTSSGNGVRGWSTGACR